MTLLYVCVVLGLLLALSWPAGRWLEWAMEPPAQPIGLRARLEALLGRITGPAEPQGWRDYSLTLLGGNVAFFSLAFLLLALQQHLPLNPDGKGALEASLIFNAVASFTSNTNLQHYSGEASLSYLSQLAALMWLQFVTPATGLAALAALARAVRGDKHMGNFVQDVLRATLFVLLPLALMVALLLAFGGVPMTFQGAAVAKTLEGGEQAIARGPVAVFVAIKQLGTNGGGWFGPNSTHPLENPSFFTNLVETLSIMLLPMAQVWMFGRIARRTRHAAVLFAVMGALLLAELGVAFWFEAAPTRALAGLPVEQQPFNLEGKELRFGQAAGPTWAVLTTATSNGSVNCMHDSLNPITGLVPLVDMWMNCTFGGVGVGLINLYLYVIAAVFIAGMMVGRSPEYLGRKVETREMRLAALGLLLHPLLILAGTALFAATAWGAGTVSNPGSHGFSEILYEFTSASANNGSGFEGLSDNTPPWNYATGIVMLLGRYLPIILPLAIAGSLASKRPSPETSGSLRCDTLMFGTVLLGTVLLVGALLFMPVAVLGPVAEHLAVQ